MGSVRRPSKHCGLRNGTYTVKISKLRIYILSSYLSRLTAAKEGGATMEIDGKKIALGVPGAKPPSQADLFAVIPLGRGGTADEAAASILLYVDIDSGHL